MREAYIICAADIIPVRVYHPFLKGTDIIEKTDLHCKSVFFMAEQEGFEPSVPFWGTHDFQSCPL